MAEVWIVPDGHPDIGWLRRQLSRDATILALNIHALVACRRLGVRVTSIEDWVPYAEITALADRAIIANQKFVELACGGARWNGYDLPAIGWQEHAYFFRDALLAERLAHALKKASASRVVWAGAIGSSRAAYTPTHDVVAAVLGSILGRAFTTAISPGKWGQDLVDKQRERFAARTALVKRELRRKAKLPKRAQVVACFSGNEWARYTDAYADLSARYGDQFQFWSMGKPFPEFKNWAEAHGTALHWLGYPAWVDKSITDFFNAQWRAWGETQQRRLATAIDSELFATGLLDFHLRQTFLGIWPRLAQWTLLLEDYFHAASPEWLVASNNYDPSWSLSRFVASKLGVPTVALPHAYALEGNVPIVSTYVACRNKLEAAMYCPPTIPIPKPLLARNAANALSYATHGDLKLEPSPRRIAMLVSDEDLGGALMAKINRSAFVETFEQLVMPPQQLADLQFVFKSHPRADVTPMLREMAAGEPNVVVLEPQRSVTDLIQGAWLVVLVNYFGSASLQAAQMGKPMLVLDTAGNYFPGRSRFPLQSGEVVDSVRAFWDVLCELATSPERYDVLTTKGEKFAREWLSEPKQTLSELLSLAPRYDFLFPAEETLFSEHLF